MESDGSDYVDSPMSTDADEKSDESINSCNYDMQMEDCTQVSYVIRKFNVVFDPPDQPRWREMSVDKLKQLIEEHRHDNSVLKFLCGVDTESEYFEGKFFEIEQDDLPPTRELKRGDTVEIYRYYKEKIYYSMIGFACKDSDGARGEAKIRVILETARRLQANMPVLLSTVCKKFLGRSGWNHEWEEDTDVKQTTPLHLLIDNEDSTDGAFRLICDTCPRLVHLRADAKESVSNKTMLVHLASQCNRYPYGNEDEDIERLRRVSTILFEAAEMTKEGARGLVVASEINTGADNYFEWRGYPLNSEAATVLHVVTQSYKHPEDALPIFLKWWPDALKHLDVQAHIQWHGESYHPFHNLFRYCDTYESLVKSIEVLMEYSTVEAFATGLLCDNIKDGYVFDSLIKVVDSLHVTIKYGYRSLEVNETMKHRLAQSVSALLQKRDADGRTLLHYITAYNIVQTNNLDDPGKMMLILGSLRKKYNEEGRTFPFNYFSWDSFNGDETLGNEMFIWEKNRRRQTQEKLGELARWILKKEPTLAESVDNEGLNPFQYAVSVGKKWSEGLDVVAGLVPGWTQAHGKVGLSPFAIAGYACDDIDTLFELLRFDSSVLSGYDVDEDTAKRDEDSSEVKDDESVKQMINEVLRPLAAILVNHPNKDLFLAQIESIRVAATANEQSTA